MGHFVRVLIFVSIAVGPQISPLLLLLAHRLPGHTQRSYVMINEWLYLIEEGKQLRGLPEGKRIQRNPPPPTQTLGKSIMESTVVHLQLQPFYCTV